MLWPPSWPRPRATSSALTRIRRSASSSGSPRAPRWASSSGGGGRLPGHRRGVRARCPKRGPAAARGLAAPGTRAGPAWRAGLGGRLSDSREGPGPPPATPNGPFPRTRPVSELRSGDRARYGCFGNLSLNGWFPLEPLAELCLPGAACHLWAQEALHGLV